MKMLFSVLILVLLGIMMLSCFLSSFLAAGISQMAKENTGACIWQKPQVASVSASSSRCVRAEAVAEAATQIASHVYGNPGVWYDAQMPEEVLTYWQGRCPAGSPCWAYWQNGNLQCVQLVTAAFALIGEPLPATGNAIDFWKLYAHTSGWTQIAQGGVGQSKLPFPGDIMVWENGGLGHVAIVTAVVPPKAGKSGSITFAQANGPGSLLTQPLLPDLSVKTWQGYQVLGYIRSEAALAQMTPLLLAEQAPALGPIATTEVATTAFYVALAREEAQKNNLPPDRFIKQIEVESAFNPTAISPAGAIGIAQFMPATAAELGINPSDPVASLTAAAALMAGYVKEYGGDYARALAAYHAGPGAVQGASQQCGTAWLSCLTPETGQYVSLILSVSLPSQAALGGSVTLHQQERRMS